MRSAHSVALEHATPARVRPITKRVFSLFQQLVHREAGIYLTEAKKALLVGRLLRRLRAHGLDSFESYYRLVEEDAAERVRMLDCVSTNETHFFRDPRQVSFLEQTVCPGWEAAATAGTRSRCIRAWSAGCSTGEEPYSLAMTLLARLPPSAGWQVHILATDLSTRALERAHAAVFSVEKAAEIPTSLLKRFMFRGVGAEDGRMKVGPDVRALVTLQRLNLNDHPYPVPGEFDLILCRNVLIYFDRAAKERVIDNLVDHLAPGGYLMLGHAESLSGLTHRTRTAGPSVYMRVPAAGAERPVGRSRPPQVL
jgi:chemotaxis protein methyltransferase CheR